VPAAAVIPAPIAYIKVVAVKKLVVEFWNGRERGGEGRPFSFSFPFVRRRSAPKGEHWSARSLLPDARSCSSLSGSILPGVDSPSLLVSARGEEGAIGSQEPGLRIARGFDGAGRSPGDSSSGLLFPPVPFGAPVRLP